LQDKQLFAEISQVLQFSPQFGQELFLRKVPSMQEVQKVDEFWQELQGGLQV